mmetsp:Transcript_35155/g.35795  ORF Transcript_35155/g.35795 Transcript_35155/m.35795 type:complete len:193 (+) Transcript_35155:111-689(+)|eukprot:CAMPEP_0182416748 /NCGR_PEP_ID=MMETSP1167-20130531/1106_1 /TAXON_ID=2988 /ORGANISM="Mallomonas Sp, Strain CCMP3275" /LENGTH=192 /DNA_ID=CAMNT_0024589785 /DNA_START=83 /DNA_END=661 /DNA_ORIENTATION=+
MPRGRTNRQSKTGTKEEESTTKARMNNTGNDSVKTDEPRVKKSRGRPKRYDDEIVEIVSPSKKARGRPKKVNASQPEMKTIVNGVEFNILAREWRMKWSEDKNKKSLGMIQQVMKELMEQEQMKSVEGIKDIQRVVCGSCHDYKVIISLPTNAFELWEKNNFKPEADFLKSVSGIEGVSNVETQTYTFMSLR